MISREEVSGSTNQFPSVRFKGLDLESRGMDGGVGRSMAELGGTLGSIGGRVELPFKAHLAIAINSWGIIVLDGAQAWRL